MKFKIPFARPLAIAAALLVAYLLFGFLAGPPIVKRILTQNVAETLKRKVEVGEVRVNPLELTLELKDFSLAESDGAPIAGFHRLFANFQLSSLFRRAWTFSEITLEGLALRADIAPDGRFNLLALLEDLPKSERKADQRPPRVLLQRIAFTGGSFTFSDRSIPTPASATLSPIDLEVHDLSTIPDALGNYAVQLRLPAGGLINWRGEATLQPLASRGEISIKGLKPLTFWHFVGYRFSDIAEPRGELDYGARYRFSYAAGAAGLEVEDLRATGRGVELAMAGEKAAALALESLELTGARAALSVQPGKPWQAKVELPKITVNGIEYTDRTRNTPLRATLKSLALALSGVGEAGANGAQVVLDGIKLEAAGLQAGEAGGPQPLVMLEAIGLEGGRIDLGAHRLALGRVKVAGGELRVERDRDGNLPLLRLVAPGDEGLVRRELKSATRQAQAAGAPWQLALDDLQVAGVHVAAIDQSFGAPVRYDARELRLALGAYASDGKAPVKFDVALRLEQGGSLSASGEARAALDGAELRAKLERIALKPLQPAVASRARVSLASGELSADLKLAYLQNGGRPRLRLGGTMRVDNFRFDQAAGGERLLAWKSFSATGLRLGLAPDELRIAEARLDGLDAKVIVHKDRSVNIMQALTLEAAQPAEGSATAKPALTTGDTSALFPVTVERVRLGDGKVDFTDESLVLPFAAKVQQLEGLVEGVSTDRASRATVRMEGRVDEYGLARAEGSLAPFRPTDFMDLAVTFRNVDMPPLSPYSATFAGRRIDSGRLSLDLRYKIDGGQLAGDNRVLLEKFTLGEKVQSEGALDLPLDLAVALLTDADGRIDLSVPVTGDINDPKFGYGTVIWQAIKIVIGKIVSAPFRALASIFGGGSEALESIAFDPGRAALLPPEQEKLKRVADGLAKRPQLRVIAEGQAGGPDRAALQSRDVANAVAARLGRAPAATDAIAEAVNVTDAKTQRALEAIFEERNGAEALNKFAADIAKARGKEVDRVNAALALIGRASADRAFYEALLARLNETARVPESALVQLAEQRTQAVVAHLTTTLAVPPERAGARAAAAPGEARVKLELEIAEKK